MLHRRLLPIVSAVAFALALAALVTFFAPQRYVATARVLLPAGAAMNFEGANGVTVSANGASRMLTIEYAASDAQLAAQVVNDFVHTHTQTESWVIDPAAAAPRRPDLALNLAFGGALGLVGGIGVVALRERRRRPVHSEQDLLDTLGVPLLAARPLRRESVRELCEQLLEHWFTPPRAALAIVSPNCGDGRSHVTAQLALCFAEMGVKTLLIDADLRSPGQHRVFKLPNRWGLAGFLEGGEPRPAACLANLSVLMAGSAARDPLELLASERLPALLAEAAKRFRVVLIDTPAAARGPDFEMFAARCGGALVVARQHNADAEALARLNAALKRCSARVVATLLNAI
jgi:protein-tyrosine kinase